MGVTFLNFFSEHDVVSVNLDRVSNIIVSYFHAKDQMVAIRRMDGFDDGYRWLAEISLNGKDQSMECWLTEEEAVALLKKLCGVNNPNSGLSFV